MVIIMNWLVLVVLAILVGNAFIGLRVGMIKTIFSLFSLIVALVLTVWISPTVNDMLKGNEKFYSVITENVDKMLAIKDENPDASKRIDLIEGFHLPQSIKDKLIENNGNKELYKSLGVNNFNEYVASYVAGIIINALAFMITFIVLIIIIWTACFALDIVSKLPILNQINKLAGFLAGLVHGLVIVWLFFLLLTVLGGTKFGQDALRMIGDNDILSLIYNNNLLLGFITSATKMFY
ncbi:MAG TPA: CvpA family protein [Mobilitalea sp.]|nr:CvpA family protein [Mobilitalea sp.]